MYDRFPGWEEGVLASQSEYGWENVIIGDMLAVDLRLKLKGYGWVQDGATTFPILYEGRYECYYRERYDTDWIHFASVVSERETSGEDSVYKDTFVELGLVDLNVYEIRIVAADAAKYATYSGGSIENITEDEQFWYDLWMRVGSPNQATPFDDVLITESVSLGKDVETISVHDDVSILDVLEYGLFVDATTSDTVGVSEIVSAEVVLQFEVFDTLTVLDVFGSWTDWVNVATPFEDVPVTENVSLDLNELFLFVFEDLTSTVDEYVGLAFSELDADVYDELVLSENVFALTEPPWRIGVFDDLSLEEFIQANVATVLFSDDCSSLTPWSDLSTGTGSVVVDSGSFLFDGDGIGNVGKIKRSTGVDCGRYYSFGFKIRHVTGNGQIQVAIGSERLNIMFKLYQDGSGPGDVEFFNGTYFTDVFDAKTEWAVIRVDILEECSDGIGNIVDLYVNDVFVGRGFCEKWTVESISNGQIQFSTAEETDGQARIDDIIVERLQQDILRYVWKRDDSGDIVNDIDVEEWVDIFPFAYPRSFLKFDDIVAVEDIIVQLIHNADIQDDVSIQENLNVSVGSLFISGDEQITIDDQVVIAGDLLEIALLFEIIAVSEHVDILDIVVEVGILDEVQIVSEWVSLVLGELIPSVYDDVSIAEYIFLSSYAAWLPIGLIYEDVSVIEDVIVSLLQLIWYEPCDDYDDWTTYASGAGVVDISPAGNFRFYLGSAVSSTMRINRDTAGTRYPKYTYEFRLKGNQSGSTLDLEIGNGNASVHIDFSFGVSDVQVEWVGGGSGVLSLESHTGGWHKYKFAVSAPYKYGQNSIVVLDYWLDDVYQGKFTGDPDSEGDSDIITVEWEWIGSTSGTQFWWDWMELSSNTEPNTIYRGTKDSVTVTESVHIAILEEGEELVYLQNCDVFADYEGNPWYKNAVGAVDVLASGGNFVASGTGVGNVAFRPVNIGFVYANAAVYTVEFRAKIVSDANQYEVEFKNGMQDVRVILEWTTTQSGKIQLNALLGDNVVWSEGVWHTYKFVVSAPYQVADGALCLVDFYVDGLLNQSWVQTKGGNTGNPGRLQIWWIAGSGTPQDTNFRIDWIKVTSNRELNAIYRSFKDDIGVTENVTIAVI